MVNNDHDAAAQGEMAVRLAKATRSGSIAAAYQELQQVPAADFVNVALMAGFAIRAGDSHRDQQANVIAQVVSATRHCTDGFGLQELARAAAKEQSNG